MISKVIMPQGGQDLEKGTVVRWLKEEGSPVAKGEVICEVETEKAVFDVNSPADGYLRKIVVPAGEEAPIFATIGLVGALEDAVEGAPAPAKPAPAPAAAPAPAPVKTQPAASAATPAGLSKIIMPQGGQDLEKGTVLRWLKEEGSPVTKGEVVCEVETEKAVFDVNAPADGYLRKIVVPAGEEAPIFATIGLVGPLEVALEAAPAPAAAPAAAVAAPAAIKPVAAPVSAVSAPVVSVAARTASGRIKISPKARKIAAQMGVVIEAIQGSGPGGRIVAKDVLAAPVRGAAAPAAEFKPVSAPVVEVKEGQGQLVRLTKLRKIIARRMQLSKQTAPHFYVTVSADMTQALKFRQQFNQKIKDPGESLSVNDLVVRACALAIQDFPQINCSAKDEDNLVQWNQINIGIAVALEEGLVVPVLENADQLPLAEIPKQTRRLAGLAKEGKQSSLAQGHFTISNLGMFNVESFTAIINPPEAAILAVASIEKRVVPMEGALMGIGVRDMMSMTISLDHRVGDGVLAAKFVNKVKALLEQPEKLI